MSKYLILGIVIFSQICFASSKEKIEEIMNGEAEVLLRDDRITSLSIGIVKNKRVITGHYGELTKKQGNRPTDHTIYEIGSVSKTMVGLLAAYAVEEGKLSLSQKLGYYLNSKQKKLGGSLNLITVQELLTHTSGLPNNIEQLGLTEESVDRSKFLDKLNEFKIEKNKGNFNYSSVGVELLSYVLEVVYQKQFDEILKEVLGENVGFVDTQVNLSNSQMPYFAYGYNDQDKVAKFHIAQNKLWGGSGFIKSSMRDLTKYMKLQLQESSSVVALSHKKLFDVDSTDSFGFLWIISKDKDMGRYIIHHGGLQSTQNWMIIFPEHDFAISIISNSSFRSMDRLLRKAAWKIASSVID